VEMMLDVKLTQQPLVVKLQCK